MYEKRGREESTGREWEEEGGVLELFRESARKDDLTAKEKKKSNNLSQAVNFVRKL